MTCKCGHSLEDHGNDPKFPEMEGCSKCGCIDFEEADDDFGETYDDGYDADYDHDLYDYDEEYLNDENTYDWEYL